MENEGINYHVRFDGETMEVILLCPGCNKHYKVVFKGSIPKGDLSPGMCKACSQEDKA